MPATPEEKQRRMEQSRDLQPGDKAAWHWGKSTLEGVIEDRSTEKVTIESKGKAITRNGDDTNPAFVLHETSPKENPNPVVKRASELEPVEGGSQ